MWTELILSIIGIFFIGGVIIFWTVQNKKLRPVDLPMNYDLVLNFSRSEFTEGHFIGGLHKKKENKNGTTLIYFYPIDIEQGELAQKPRIYKFVAKNENMKWVNGKYRKILVITSKNKEDYPSEIRETLEANFMTSEGLKAYMTSVFAEGLREKDKVTKELMALWGGGEITSHALGKLKEENDKFVKMINLLKDQTDNNDKKP